jgi:hypothetical protein
VAKSTCKTEGRSQALWLCWVLEEVTGVGILVPTIRMDNTTTIVLAKNLVLHDRSKHIYVKFHFTREEVERGDISLEHVGTGDELADILTKSLGRIQFQELHARIGVIKGSTIKVQK